MNKAFKQTEIDSILDDWKTYTIGEVSEVIGGGTPLTKIKEYFDGDIPWITPRDLSGYEARYISRGERNITKLGLDKSSAKLVPKGTVLLTSRAPVGYVAIASNEVATNQGFRSLVVNDKLVNNEFLYYLFKNNTDYLKSNASGTTFGELSGTTLKNLEFLFPPLSEQKSIAEILSSLDDKIELNQKMNATLKKIAQAIFKHWFIDFEFSNEEGKPYKSSGSEMVDSELGEIPKGWKINNFYELAEYINGAPFKKEDFSPEQKGLPIIKIVELKYGITTQTQFTKKKVDSKYFIDDMDLLFSWSGSPETSIDIFIWNLGRGILNQHTFKVIPKGIVNKTWIFNLLKFYKPLFIHIAKQKQTTGLGHVTVADLKEYKIVFPDISTLDKFDKLITPFIAQIFTNSKEKIYLFKIRDSLLPKLMSGKIRVKETNNER